MTHQENSVWKTRIGNVSKDMKVPRYSCSRLSDDLGVWDTLYTTDLKVRGDLSSRLPDEFSNSATNLFVRLREGYEIKNYSTASFSCGFSIKDLRNTIFLIRECVWKTRCQRRIAAGSWTRGIIDASSKKRLKDAERQLREIRDIGRDAHLD